MSADKRDLIPVRDVGTFGIIKGPSVDRGHVLTVLDALREARLKIRHIRVTWTTPDVVDDLYREHLENPYYHFAQKVLTPPYTIVPFIVEPMPGEDPVAILRDLIGEHSDSRKCAEHTLRHKLGGFRFGSHPDFYADNVLHGSKTREEALREARLFFDIGEDPHG